MQGIDSSSSTRPRLPVLIPSEKTIHGSMEPPATAGDEAASLNVFRLMDLPKELRLRMYRMAFEDTHGHIRLFMAETRHNVIPEMAINFSRRPAPALLLVNRFVHEEAVEFFHSALDWEIDFCNAGGSQGVPSINLRQLLRHAQDMTVHIEIPDAIYDQEYLAELVPVINAKRPLRELNLVITESYDSCLSVEEAHEDTGMLVRSLRALKQPKKMTIYFADKNCNEYWPKTVEELAILLASKNLLSQADLAIGQPASTKTRPMADDSATSTQSTLH